MDQVQEPSATSASPSGKKQKKEKKPKAAAVEKGQDGEGEGSEQGHSKQDETMLQAAREEAKQALKERFLAASRTTGMFCV